MLLADMAQAHAQQRPFSREIHGAYIHTGTQAREKESEKVRGAGALVPGGGFFFETIIHFSGVERAIETRFVRSSSHLRTSILEL